jgi:hypothetical protein
MRIFNGSLWQGLIAVGFDNPNIHGFAIDSGGIDWGAVPSVSRLRVQTDWIGAPWTPRNMLINAGMYFWQRGNSFAGLGSGTVYTADRWAITGTVSSARVNVRRVTGSDLPLDAQVSDAIEVMVAHPQTTVNSGQIVQMMQPIEGSMFSRTRWGVNSAGRMCRLSFKYWSNVTGRISISIQNNSRQTTFLQYFDISNTSAWVTETLSINRCNSGAWHFGTEVGCYLGFTLMAGTNFRNSNPRTWLFNTTDPRCVSGQLNMFGASGSILRLMEVQFELGHAQAPFETIPLPWERQLCRRYFDKTFPLDEKPREGSGVMAGALGSNSDDGGYNLVTWQINMRRTPDITYYCPSGTGIYWWCRSLQRRGRPAYTLASGADAVVVTSSGNAPDSGSFAFDRHLIHATADAEFY